MPAPVNAFDPSILPPKPDIIPPELRHLTADNTSDWSHRIPQQAVGMVVAAVVRWLSDPRMGTKVDVHTHDDGWTIDVRLSKPEPRDDVVMP